MSDIAEPFLPEKSDVEYRDSTMKSPSLLSSLITKIGNFSVQYNYQALSIALVVMSVVKCTSTDDNCREGEQEEWVHSTSTATVFVGSITGQLTMGFAGDIFGRDAAMGLTLSIAAFSALLSSIATMGTATDTYAGIIVFRFFLGIGLGGVYPLAATKAAEDSASRGGKSNSVASALSFFWQTPGSMAPWVVALILVNLGVSNDLMWRLLLGIGAVPSLIVVLCVYLDEKTNVSAKSEMDIAKEQDLRVEAFKNPDLWWELLGTGGSWFLFDICYYGVGLFGGAIIAAMGEHDDVTTKSAITDIAWKQVVALGMGIPACLLTIYHMQYYPLKKLQIIGFILFIFGFVAMAAAFFPLKEKSPDALFTLYCFLLFALQYGPNVTTYVLPASIYQKQVRSTMNGFSAAMGKLGAVVGAYLFGTIAELSSFPTVMLLCAGVSLLGIYVTYKFIPDAKV